MGAARASGEDVVDGSPGRFREAQLPETTIMAGERCPGIANGVLEQETVAERVGWMARELRACLWR